jgi:hypothetical protein
VSIVDFTHDGAVGLPETQGGLVSGDIPLGLNPAPHTTIQDDFFFNELLLPFTSFGTSITFAIQIIGSAPGVGTVPDEFAFFILGATRQPLFASFDPLGADAFFAIDVDGTSSGVLSPFAPTKFTPPDLLEIPTVPAIAQPCDANGDGTINRQDARDLFRFLRRGGEPLLGNPDCNGDGAINSQDVRAILQAS